MNKREIIARAKKDFDAVYAAGKRTRVEFMKVFQQMGARTNYWYGFSGYGWTQSTLVPEYKITFAETNSSTQLATGMFYRCNGGGGSVSPIDFSEISDKFDFSGLKSARNLFDSASMINIYADLSSCEVADSAFARSWGGYLDKITVKVTSVMRSCSNMFLYNNTLKELTFTDDSEIACNGMNLSAATQLTAESIESVILALSDNTTGLSITLPSTAEATFDAAYGEGNFWRLVLANADNWTVNLA